MLTLENLHLIMGDFNLTANWSVDAGTRLAIIGPSGAGKSTLLMAIAGFVPIAAGQITWTEQDGAAQDIVALAPGDRPLSILFQEQNLFPHLTVTQNLGLGLSPQLALTRQQQDQIATALARVGLAGMGARKPGALSGGQQGRVALARALLRSRPILLLDEPFAALGPALKAEMLDLVADVATAAGATVLLVTHDPADAKRFADQTVLVANGTAHSPVPTATLFENPPKALSDYLGS